MTGLRLLADDLTGALDSAATFCGARGPIPVWLTPPAKTFDAALDLACRDGDEPAAVDAVRASVAFLAGAEIAYLKIDSLLRGHWAAMLAALWRAGAFARCVLAPAFPAQDRVTVGGRQYVRAPDGALDAVAIDPLAALAGRGVPVGPESGWARLYDAASHQDLMQVARQAAALPGPTLWCGSAGLAMALARVPAPAAAPSAAPLLAIVGSRHPVSEAQTSHLRDATGRSPLLLRGEVTEAAHVAAHCHNPGFCVLRVDIPPDTSPPLAATLIADALARLLPGLAPPGTLVVSGGETLRAACQALGATRLDVEAEVETGIPRSRLRGGLWDGVAVVSKSGAFGSADLLARLLVRSGEHEP